MDVKHDTLRNTPSAGRLRSVLLFVSATLLLLGPGAPGRADDAAADTTVDLATWTSTGDATVTREGVLEVSRGGVSSPAEIFENGTISFEVQMSGQRSFVYAIFRRSDLGNLEEIYFRPHKSDLPDALQYSPRINGASQWQLFHGATGTAAVSLPPSYWIPVRLEVEGRKLAVFVGAGSEPDLVIPQLAHAPRAGAVDLRSFIPVGSEAPYGARFRNLRVTSEVTFDFDSVEPPAIGKDGVGDRVIRDWRFGPTFSTSELLVEKLPTVPDDAWQTLELEADGTALLHRLPRAKDTDVDGVVARLEIEAEAATSRRLDLAWSDAITVFLNGRPLVSLDHSYSYDEPRRQGVMGLHQARLHLPLERGTNDLRIVVTDVFGGWGLKGRWVP